MVKRKKSKQKIKGIYKKSPAIVDTSPKVKAELQELEAKKQKAVEGKKGIKRFFTSLSYNKAIYDKKNILKKRDRITNLQQKLEEEKVKSQIREFKKKNIDFNKFKGIKIEDLY